MNELNPRQPKRPFIWPEIIMELRDRLSDQKEEIYIVGGAVRDAMLHRPLHDIDLATSGDGIRLARKIANLFNGDFFALDETRDVGRALIDTPDGHLVADVARFRGNTLYEDLVDRDFTLNAMAVDLKGDLNLLIDPLNGELDIAAKLVRQCKPGALADDPVRSLRAVRQSIQLSLRIEPETLRALREVIPQLTSVSPERIRDEWVKILSLPRPSAALRVADKAGLLEAVVPEVMPLHNVVQPAPYIHDAFEHTLAVIENMSGILATINFTRTDNTAASFGYGMIAMQLDRFRGRLQAHLEKNWPNERNHRSLLMLAALLQGVGKVTKEKTYRADYDATSARLAEIRTDDLRFSNAEHQWVVQVVKNGRLPLQIESLTPLAIHHFWRDTGEAGVDICLFSLAEFLATYGMELPQDYWLSVVERARLLLEAYFEKHDELVSPPVLIDGNQLMKYLKLKPGRMIGELLDHIRDQQVTGAVRSFDEALETARLYFSEHQEG